MRKSAHVDSVVSVIAMSVVKLLILAGTVYCGAQALLSLSQ